MSLVTFDQQDFDVFIIDGLDERMNALISRIRPKLERLGTELAPKLTEIVGNEMYAHVAKHARRTVNPPDDTWVAWAGDKRGYKKHPHFQVGLWETHFFVCFAIIYESPNKADFASHALAEIDLLKSSIPNHFVWSVDHTQPEATSHAEFSKDELQKMLERLQKVKKAEILCGIHIDRHDSLLQDGEELLKCIIQTFETLAPLYRLAQPR